MNLTTDVALAEQFGVTVEKLHALRKRHNWPCVKFGRFEVRFTDAQVEQIVASHTIKPTKAAAKETGLTERSARRSA